MTLLQGMVDGLVSRYVSTVIVELLGLSILDVNSPLTAAELGDQDTVLNESTDLLKRYYGVLAVFGSEQDLLLWADANLPRVAHAIQTVFGCPPSSASMSTPSSSVSSSPPPPMPSSPCPSIPPSAFEFSSSSPSPHQQAASTTPTRRTIGLFDFSDDSGPEEEEVSAVENVHAVAEGEDTSEEDSPSPRHDVAATAPSIYPIGLLPVDSDDSESEEDEVPVVEWVHAATAVEGTSEGEYESESDDDPPHWSSSSGDTSGSSSIEQISISAQGSSGRSAEWTSASTSTSLDEVGLEDSEEELDESLSRDFDPVGVRHSVSQSSSVGSVSAGPGQGKGSEHHIPTLAPSSPSPSLAAVSAPSNDTSLPPAPHLRSGLQSVWETLPAEQGEARAAQNAAASSTATLVPSTSVHVETDESPNPPRSSSLDTTSRTHPPSAVSSSGDSFRSSSDSASRSANTTVPSSKSRKRRLALSATPSPNLSSRPPPSSSVLINVEASNAGSPVLHQSKKHKAPALIYKGPHRELSWYIQRVVVRDQSLVPMPRVSSGIMDIASKCWTDFWRDWWGMSPRWERVADAPLGEFRLHFLHLDFL